LLVGYPTAVTYTVSRGRAEEVFFDVVHYPNQVVS
jgi:hypothetical protein